MTAVLTSHELVQDYGADTVDLFRWRSRGWLHPEVVRSGGDATNPARATTWPDWTGRMVRLLHGERVGVQSNGGRNVPGTDARTALFVSVASTLAEHPDVPWVVFVDDDPTPLPCWYSHDVAAACRGVELRATIVAVPT